MNNTALKIEIEQNQIYVACLSAYNNGILHGKWITPSNDLEILEQQYDEVRKTSPMPDSDELAIHDYNYFPNLGEYPNLEQVIEVIDAINNHGYDVVNAFIECFAMDGMDRIDEAYCGTYDTFEDFAEQDFDERYLNISDTSILNFIDMEKYESDLRYDYNDYDTKSGVIVFRNI